MVDLDEIKAEFIRLGSDKLRMNHLGEAYPRLYIFVLEHFKKPHKIAQYMAKCKECENDHRRFSLYVQGFFLV